MKVIGTGRASTVYALDADKVLRRSTADTTAEARLMVHLRQRAFPVPAVFEASGGDLIMERLHGPTLAAELISGRIGPVEAAKALLALHERLHELEAPDWLPVTARGIELAYGDMSARILHLDLNAANVILADDDAYLIDWTNAAAGNPEIDVAVTWTDLAGVDLGAHGVPKDRVTEVRAGLLKTLRTGISEQALGAAMQYRAADTGVTPEEITRARTELARVR